MTAVLKLPVPTPSETRSERGLAPIAANDNIHLHLVKNNDDNPFVSVPFSAGSSATGPRTLSYDARGNVTALGGLFFTYDMSDQPTAISGNGPNGMVSGTYTYDGNLKRVRSIIDGKTIYNIYDAGGTLIHIHKLAEGLTPEQKTDMIGKVARVTTSGGVDKITYLHNDHLGSANTGTDALGNVLWREQYTPFGSTLTSPLANQDQAGFTGHIKDSATGLNYMQARYYDPLIGRFLSRDPIGFSIARPEMFSSYTYVNNDPMNGTDPTGKRGNSCSMSGCISDPHMQKVGTGPLTNGDKVVLGVGSLFIPGPEDVVVGAIIATKIGQGLLKVGSKIAAGAKKLLRGNKTTIDVGSPPISVGNTPDVARADLDAAGFPSSPTTQTSEVGTVHSNIPGADGAMDVRIMNGQTGSASGTTTGPRIVTTRAGSGNDGVKIDGSKFKNNESKAERNAGCHTSLECN